MQGGDVSGGKKQVFVLVNGLGLIHGRKDGFPVSLYIQNHPGYSVKIQVPRPLSEICLQ